MHSRTRHFYLGLGISLRPSMPPSLSLSFYVQCTCFRRNAVHVHLCTAYRRRLIDLPCPLRFILAFTRDTMSSNAMSNRWRAMWIVIERGPWEISGNLIIWRKNLKKIWKKRGTRYYTWIYIGWNEWFEIKRIRIKLRQSNM